MKEPEIDYKKLLQQYLDYHNSGNGPGATNHPNRKIIISYKEKQEYSALWYFEMGFVLESDPDIYIGSQISDCATTHDDLQIRKKYAYGSLFASF